MLELGLGRPNHVVITANGHHYWYSPRQALALADRIIQAANQAMHGSVPPCDGEYGLEN
jgi:hypothetical protein